MSSSKGDPSNKTPWYRSMMAKFNHVEKTAVLAKRTEARGEKKVKKVLDT